MSLYAQVRIHYILGLSPFSLPFAIQNNAMRARILSVSFANASRAKRDRKGHGEIKATEGTKEPFNKGSSDVERIPGAQGRI